MILVRNATGISHSPGEAIRLEDAEFAVGVVARALSVVGGVSP
jgi:acetylornithine deacetylase/succinyl-diaminopimelate desuccinylase-like protein